MMASDSRNAEAADGCRLFDAHSAGVAALLLVGFTVLYFGLARDFSAMPGYSTRNNIFFGADQVDAQDGWIDHHKGIHPLVLLIVVPATRALEIACESTLLGLHLFASATGGTLVALVFLFLQAVTGNRARSAAVAAFFGVSMSQLVFGSFADTYVLAAISSMPTWFLTLWSLRTGKAPFWWWVTVGIISFAVTMTMFVNTLVCLTIVLVRQESWKAAFRPLAGVVASVLVAGVGLSLIQKNLMPDAQVFWQPDSFSHETQYASPLIVEQPSVLVSELSRHFSLYAFVAPPPKAEKFVPQRRLKLAYFQTPLRYGLPGLIACGLWLCLLAYGIVRAGSDKGLQPLILCMAIAIAGNVVLHSCYNTRELFLYTPHFAFLILMLSAVHRDRGWLMTTAWCTLSALTAWNNLAVHQNNMERYAVRASPQLLEPLVHSHDVWRIKPGAEHIGQDWLEPGYDDSDWTRGRSGFGYGDNDDHTELEMKDRYSTVFIRRSFEVNNPSNVNRMHLDVRFDDGFMIWINGQFVAAENAPEVVHRHSLATEDHEAGLPWRFFVPPEVLQPGKNVITAVGLNRSLDSSDLTLEVALSAVNRH